MNYIAKLFMFTDVVLDGVVHYAMSVWCIRAADMDRAMEARGNVSAIRIGEEYYVIKVMVTLNVLL